VPGLDPVERRDGSVCDQCLGRDESRPALIAAPVRAAQGPPRTELAGQFTMQRAASGYVEGLVDRFGAQVPGGLVREGGAEMPADLLRTPLLAQFVLSCTNSRNQGSETSLAGFGRRVRSMARAWARSAS
jgi:hypothetical protein